MRVTTIRLDDVDTAHIVAVARERGSSVSAVVRELIARDRADETPALAPIADREEILALLTKAARRGSVTATRALLAETAPASPQADAQPPAGTPFTRIVDQVAERRRHRAQEGP